MDPVALFPAEIWVIIFDKIEEPQDWLNLYWASPSFEGVVGQQRTTALFPLVLPHLRPYLMYRYLGPAVLYLRLVSPSWKSSVDTTLEGLGLNEKNFRCNLKYDFWTMGSLSSFLDKFSHHPANPIIGRSVRFSYRRYPDQRTLEDSRALISRAMNQFGLHIRKLTVVDFTSRDTQQDNLFLRLRHVVGAAPALESLSLTCCHDEENNNELTAFVKNHPLPARPVISGLKSLQLWGFRHSSDRELMVKLQNLVISTCCSPDSLRKVNVVGVPEALRTFPKVENAKVFLMRNDHLKLARVSWPLTSLTLVPDEQREIRSLFEIAEIFMGTLTSLTIDISKNLGVPGDSMDFRVELPHLQYLQIPQIISFGIFANLGSLEVLTVYNSKCLKKDEKADLVEAIRKEMERSWGSELLPKLRQVLLKGDVSNEAGNDDISFQRPIFRKVK